MKGEDLRTLPPGDPRGAPCTLDCDGELVRAYEGEPVAVALFAAGIRVLARSPKYHRPRGLFCGDGHCGSCLMRIDGRPNVLSCVTPARADLRCERPNTFPDPEIDLLAAADWLFPGGMDHHRLMTGSRLGNDLFVKLVRQMGGTGLLPTETAPVAAAARDLTVDLCVVGAGPAGLSAATAFVRARPGKRAMVFDEGVRAGGSLLAEPGGVARAAALAQEAQTAGVQLELRSRAIGAYRDAASATSAGSDRPATLAIITSGSAGQAGLLRVRAGHFLYATGSYDQNLPLLDNDRPGMLSARAVGRLAFLHGVRPGRRVYVLPGPQPFTYLDGLLAGLAALGVPADRAEPATEIGETVKLASGRRLDLRKDVIAVGALPSPASELPRQHGVKVTFEPTRGGFVAVRSDDGLGAPAVSIAGDVVGWMGPAEAAADGARVGAALAARRDWP